MTKFSGNSSISSKSVINLERLKKWFDETDVKILQGIPLLGAFFFMFGLPIIFYIVFGADGFQNFDLSFALPVSMFFFGLSSFVGVFKQEFYWKPYRNIEGKSAVIVGVISTVMFVTLSILMIVLKQME